MKAILSLIISGALVVSGYAQTRNVLVGTNNAVVQPTNFWSADASNARVGLGLGSAATNPASAFQPSSATLSNLSLGNGSGLTNVTASAVSSALAISNTAGLQAALDGKLATNGSAAGLTNFPSAVLQTNSSLSTFPEGLLRTNGSAIGLTNFPVIPVTSGGTGGTNAQTARNGIGLGTTNTLTIAGLVAQNLTIESGGGITLQAVLTNAGSFRTNIGLPWSGLTNSDAASFRTELGLGTAATNASSAFQPSSSALTNISSGNGGSLTNLQATNLVGIIPASNISTVTLSNIGGTLPIAQGGTSATNAANARVNLGSTVVGDAVFVATNAAAARTAIGGTTIGSSVFTLANPSAITFLRLNADNTASALSAVDFRTAIGLGTAATNAASAFQPSSSALTNLAANNGSSLTNIPVVGVAGALSTNGSAAGLTNFPASLLTTNGNGAGLTNLTAANITGTVGRASNVTGTIAISNGGSGATTAGGARTNFGLGATNNVAFGSVAISGGDLQFSNDSIYWAGSVRYSPEDQLFFGTITIEDGAVNFGGTNIAANKAATRANLGLGNISTNTFQTTNTAVYINTNIVATNGKLITTNIESSYIEAYNFFVVDGTNGITFETANIAAISRTNFGLPWSGLTNTNALTFRSALELGTTNTLTIAGVTAQNLTITAGGGITLQSTLTNAASFRTNIGLPLAALTNTNNTNFLAAFFGANTNPVLVNTNGEVVSPTNFWQVAPIQTLVQDLTVVVTSQTNNATNARNLYVYSLGTNVSGISNTIILPTNAATFAGDEVTVIHQGTTNTTTVVRQAGSTNNLITLNRFDEAVKFIRESGQWDFYHNISFVEPIQFSGTNASSSAAQSRTNLGLGLPALTNSDTTNFQAAVFQTNTTPAGAAFNNIVAWMEVNVFTNGSNTSFRIPLFK